MRALVFAAATLLATTAQAGWFGSDCREQAERSAVQSAAGVTRVVIIGRAGFLHVEGRQGATEIRARGTACASTEELLVAILFKSTRSGSTVTIEAMVPNESESFFSSSPSLDMTVTVPAGMAVTVTDTSGELTIKNTGETDVDDRSGGLEIHHVTGNVTVRDTSGEIVIEDVSGNVHIPSDSSGSIAVRHVGGSVTIDEDGSGSIDVDDIGGDFTLGRKGSGSVNYERVRGRVSVPMKHRHRD
jgi:DUF4097 and DUF4098 domain-containing protein YvlB